ncbi:tudor domain protein [Dictyocaulus viviparus]|uniref:Tudor domain protein n=1 Tax=Dictyocaulus viviparus TaxID=29172 RepID=A0A0D8YB45_DICVI|nr:tudor domain protein [Dictyocaulus viviparus]
MDEERFKESIFHTRTTQQKKYPGERLIASKGREPSAVKCFSQDLPLGIATKVRVVNSPYSCEYEKYGFVFHVVPLDQNLGEEYSALQREMNRFCLKSSSLRAFPTVGQYVLFFRANIAYRAVCNSDLTVYLIDTGEVVPTKLSQLWDISDGFALLPGLVIPCSIFGISWVKSSPFVLDNCRNALKQWSDSYVNGLTATVNKYSGLVNVVQLEAMADGVIENFAVSITAKGLCTRQSYTHNRYSRETLLDIRNSEASRRMPYLSSKNYVEEIIIGLQTVSVA